MDMLLLYFDTNDDHAIEFRCQVKVRQEKSTRNKVGISRVICKFVMEKKRPLKNQSTGPRSLQEISPELYLLRYSRVAELLRPNRVAVFL